MGWKYPRFARCQGLEIDVANLDEQGPSGMHG